MHTEKNILSGLEKSLQKFPNHRPPISVRVGRFQFENDDCLAKFAGPAQAAVAQTSQV